MSLYERLGGEKAVEAAVSRFYEKVLGDPLLAPMFDGVDMQRQARHQINFMTFAFGGLNHYSGRGLRAAHARLVNEKGLSEIHFNHVTTHLQSTLEELGVPIELIEEIMKTVGSTKEDILAG